MKLINNIEETIDQITRIDGKWWDGLKPGETIETDDPYVIKALLKHGAEEFGKKKEEKPKEEKPPEPKEKKPPKKKHEELPTPKIEYEKLTVVELREIAKEKGLKVRGSKAQIIERLKDAL